MNYTLTYDQWMACLCIWREARGASIQAMTAIYNVMLNRSNDARNRWPKTLPAVITEHHPIKSGRVIYQFSSFAADDPNVVKFPMPPSPGAPSNPDWEAFLKCIAAVTAPLGADPTDGATNYESCKPGELPKWADPAKMTTEIGPFRFYKL